MDIMQARNPLFEIKVSLKDKKKTKILSMKSVANFYLAISPVKVLLF